MAYDLSIAQLRYTKAQFAASNPTPSAGQLCVETDSNTYTTGDGSSTYLSIRGNTTLSGTEREHADVAWDVMRLSDGRDDEGEVVTELSSNAVENASSVPGATATAALNHLLPIRITRADAEDGGGSGALTPAAGRFIQLTDTYEIYEADGVRNIAAIVAKTTVVSGTTYTVQATDAGKTIVCTNASGCTVTVDANAPEVAIMQAGTGTVTIAQGTSGTIHARSMDTYMQWSVVFLKYYSTAGEYFLAGELA